MNHASFLELRRRLLGERPELVDLAELNLYRSLQGSFAPIAPSDHPQAPYRCHLAERFLERLGLAPSLRPRALVSHGVRRSLRALFGLLAAEGARVALPGDVYPVYLQLAAEAGLSPTTWQSRLGLPSAELLEETDALLICEPLKPWGRPLDAPQVARLAAWARSAPHRLLLVDSAYSTPPTPAALALFESAGAGLLSSLSKGFLIPDHAGLCLLPEALGERGRAAFAALEKDERRLRIGYAALTEHAGRPGQVGGILRARAERLDAFTAARPALQAGRCAGYFATAARPFDELLALGVLAVPAELFGGPASHSVLSSLEPASAEAVRPGIQPQP